MFAVGTIVFLVVGVMAVCAMFFPALVFFILICSNYLEYCCGAGQSPCISSSLLSGI